MMKESIKEIFGHGPLVLLPLLVAIVALALGYLTAFWAVEEAAGAPVYSMQWMMAGWEGYACSAIFIFSSAWFCIALSAARRAKREREGGDSVD